MNKAYQEYLESDKWKTIRAQRLAMDNGECALCVSKAYHVHHRRYPKELGTETISDLVSLCEDCHNKFHDIEIKRHHICVVCNKAFTATIEEQHMCEICGEDACWRCVSMTGEKCGYTVACFNCQKRAGEI